MSVVQEITAVQEPRNACSHVVVGMRNQLERFGIEQMLKGLGREYLSLGDAEQAARSAIGAGRAGILIVSLREADPRVGVLLRQAAARGNRVLVLVDEPDLAQLAHLAGVSGTGFLASADLDKESLRSTLDRICTGEVPMPPELAYSLLELAGGNGGGGDARRGVRMTPREQETLGLLVEGCSNKQIARRLDISEHGAKRLVANILGKLDSPNRTMAVARALREGLCRPDGHTAVGA
ncbi:LuxR C-terminal-related transcriptional regulator [Streptomyces sp. NPDC096205]|uniref:helix-turn-helix transcriptional regulator n=1 Tax=Streptomyces sp. NPDC096205 TaxID=3366081 RepID=UPI00380CAFFD